MIYLMDRKLIEHNSMDSQAADVRFRRATTNMIASTLLLEKMLATENAGKVGLLYVSHFGEVLSSTDFLYSARKEQLAKPILFQNSLHNAVLGFLSINLKLQGPCITMSAGQNMNSSIAYTLKGMLEICETMVVCMSDSIPEKFLNGYQESFPHLKDVFNRTSCFLFKKLEQPPTDFQEIIQDDFKFISY